MATLRPLAPGQKVHSSRCEDAPIPICVCEGANWKGAASHGWQRMDFCSDLEDFSASARAVCRDEPLGDWNWEAHSIVGDFRDDKWEHHHRQGVARSRVSAMIDAMDAIDEFRATDAA